MSTPTASPVKCLRTSSRANTLCWFQTRCFMNWPGVLRYPRLQAFYNLPENLVFDYVDFLRRSSEIVTLDPLVTAPIRDVNDVIVMQTAIIGEADILCK